MITKSSVHSLFSLQFKNPKKELRPSSSCYHINNQSNIILLQPERKGFSSLKGQGRGSWKSYLFCNCLMLYV